MRHTFLTKSGYLLAGLLAVSLLGSCGNDSTVPADGELIVDTASISYTHLGTPVAGGGCTGIVNGVGINTSDATIKVITVGADGNPAGKIDVEVSASFAENTSAGGAVTALFFIDKGVDVLISAVADPAPYTVTTDEFGELFLKFRYDTTYDANCIYQGQVKIASGLHAKNVDFSVAIAK